MPCPVPVVVDLIGGKWKLLILQILIFHGTKRFGELRKRLDGVTQTMLTNQLRSLEADGLVSRKIYPEVPPRVEYSATKAGMDLKPVFEAMHHWWEQQPQLHHRLDELVAKLG
ncbi:MAG: helix-turn-helix transcriptional regulator [Sneathiella sp.]|nr:helix-turn-helix transcriptional regulator [Sneathiella sp.]